MNCDEEKDFCKNAMYIEAPTTVVFKGQGVDMFEIFHGKKSTGFDIIITRVTECIAS